MERQICVMFDGKIDLNRELDGQKNRNLDIKNSIRIESNYILFQDEKKDDKNKDKDKKQSRAIIISSIP